jgi:DNA repair exonuclease SbcCD ATPase subunit
VSEPHLQAIELQYGCHSGRYDLPDEARPVVIAGGNGSGKTTLLEAFLRTLYGFSRRKTEERRLLELRQPWSGRPAEAEVWLHAADGRRFAVHRDFASDQVVVSDDSAGREVFRGDGNPVGVRSESRRYQDLLREWVGFGTLEPYRGTAWIAQGELVDTKLDDELLRAAAGTHRKVDTALKELREAFEALTREPIEPGGRAKRLDRGVEELRKAIALLVDRLEAAREARRRKRPVLEQARAIQSELDEVEAEIGLLEAAYRPITERRTLLAEQKQAETHLATLTEALRSLEETADELGRSEAEQVSGEAGGRYPDDFEARLGQAELLWDRVATLEHQLADTSDYESVTSPAWRSTSGMAGVALALLGGAIALTLSATVGTIVAVAGFFLGAAAVRQTRSEGGSEARAVSQIRRLEEDLAGARARLKSIAAGVPAPEFLPVNVAAHRTAFTRQEEARSAAVRARDRADEAAERAARLLDSTTPGDPGGEDVRRRLEAAREAARTNLARVQLRLEEQPSTPVLPGGVDPTVPAVEAARDDRRARREALSKEHGSLQLEIRDLDRASEDVFALEEQLAGLQVRLREVESEVAARRFAWELVRDSYEEFRATDQDRLLAAVNRKLDELSGGHLGPVTALGDLATARLGMAGREVALDSPPLSFGEKHVALLAIRLGAADFLAGEGIRHPLLVDEPFTHLDEVHSREVWNLLLKLASERQVIVTTQDRLVLDHLGIQPDVDLAAVERAGKAEAARDRREGNHTSTRPPGGGETTLPAPSPTEPAQEQLELG